MNFFNTRKLPIKIQLLISVGFILIISIICYFTSEFIGYRIVSLILLMAVTIIAMFFEMIPVLVGSVLSAFIWNFFFIPPLYTLHINETEDVLIFMLYILITLVNATLTFKIREAETNARDKEEKVKTILLYNTLLNSLSHELRTPISIIIGAIDALKDKNNPLSDDYRNELLHVMDIASIRLNRQVENLLNMSRLESGMLKPELDWCDMKDLITSTITKLGPIKGHKIEFICQKDIPLFKIDSGLLEQVIQNLLHNAIQYTPVNSIIKIELEAHVNQLRIIISDNGLGFPADEINKAFDKFYRVPNSKVGGSGLGLSIVKGFVEACNGTITLKNNDLGGASFTIDIPAETSFLNNLKNE